MKISKNYDDGLLIQFHTIKPNYETTDETIFIPVKKSQLLKQLEKTKIGYYERYKNVSSLSSVGGYTVFAEDKKSKYTIHIGIIRKYYVE